jgi:6-phospho-3-hexuloisomerase
VDDLSAGGSRPWLAVGVEVAQTLETVDPEQFAAVVEAFANPGRRWFFTGQGRSGLVARMAAMRVMHLDRTAHVLGEATAPSVRAGDGLVVLSGSGATPVSLGFATIARQEGARVLAITAQGASPLAELADTALVLRAGESAQLGGSLFEQTSLLVLDALIFTLGAQMGDAHGSLARRHTNMQ